MEGGPAWQVFLRFVAGAVLAAITVALIAYTIEVLCLIFAGIVFGVFLTRTRDSLATWLHLPRLLALLLMLALFAGAVTGLAVWLVPRVAHQFDLLLRELPAYLSALRTSQYGGETLQAVERALEGNGASGAVNRWWAEGTALFSQLAGVFSSGFSAVAAGIVVVAIGLHIAFEPALYRRGVLSLTPVRVQPRMIEVLDRCGGVISWWFLGQMLSMAVLGSAMSLGLWLIGIPFALLFGLFTALMTFIPNLGPIIAAVPIVLVSLTQGVEQTVYVLLLVVVLQNVEGLLLTPLVHRRLVALPPAVVLASLLMLGSIAGLMGAIITMPLVATVIAAVKVLVLEPREQAAAGTPRGFQEPPG
jgi:predicted PurR-regulated permease PerM